MRESYVIISFDGEPLIWMDGIPSVVEAIDFRPIAKTEYPDRNWIIALAINNELQL